MASVALQGTPTTQCLDALTTAMCAYHFTRCVDDEKRFPSVCYETCRKLEDQCKIQLDDVVLVQVGPYTFVQSYYYIICFDIPLEPLQGRCQGPPAEDGSSQGREKCTAGAHNNQLQFSIVAVPLFVFLHCILF
jgi:hypothetical protein